MIKLKLIMSNQVQIVSNKNPSLRRNHVIIAINIIITHFYIVNKYWPSFKIGNVRPLKLFEGI